MNESFDPRSAKSIFGRIGGMGTLGGLAGGLLAERVAAWVSSSAVVLVMAILHLACASLLWRAFPLTTAAGKIAEQLRGAVPLVDTQTLDRAIAHAYAAGSAGDTVLLAPACASFDQFRSYEHRGEVFKQLVNQLEGKE